jgi:hypothetical protein
MDQTEIDSAYFARRASEEQAAADRAHDPRARQTHADLARLYSRAARACGRKVANDEHAIAPGVAVPLLQPEFRILA